MKKALKIVVIVIAAVFIIAQFIRPDRINPPIVEAETLQSSIAVPADVQAVLVRSCNDCHTNNTSYPWYSNVSPISWFLANHIKDGRRNLNFSVWNTYTPKKKSKKLEEVCEQVETNEMPLPSYLWIHRSSALTEADARLLCDWANREKAVVDAANPN